MTERKIYGQVVVETKGLGGVRQRLEKGNYVNGWYLRSILYSMWDGRWYQNPGMYLNQWKLPPLFPTPNVTANWACLGNDAAHGYYPVAYGQGTISSWDMPRFRRYRPTAFSQSAGDNPRVFAGVLASAYDGGNEEDCRNNWDQPRMFSVADIPTTQIGIPYAHPIYTFAVEPILITSGSSWVRVINNGNAARAASYWDRPGSIDHFYITGGSFKGQYWPRHCYYSWGDSYMYIQLMNLDGTLFNPYITGGGTETATGWAHGANRSWFNQVSVMPNGTGTVSVDGTFQPGVNRQSYILRIYPHKSGSPSPADASQKGTYWFSLRPFHSGVGDLTTDATAGDGGFVNNNRIFFNNGFHTYNSDLAQNTDVRSECMGYAFDESTQRLWMIMDKQGSDGSSICFWLYKSPETPIEVASTVANGGYNKQILSAPVGAAIGTNFMGIDIDSDGTVYIANSRGGMAAGTGKLITIKRDLTVAKWGTADGLPGDYLTFVPIDRSRLRTGTNLDTTVGTGNLVDHSSSMTAYDIGRVIKITTGADTGTYKISVITDSQNFTVTDLTGGAVSFAGDSGKSWKIGERVYLFFSDYTTNSGHIHYMETLAPGTFMSLTLSGVTAAGRDPLTGLEYAGTRQRVSIDQRTGCVYWISSEVAGAYANTATNWAVYKLNPSTGLVQSRNGNDLLTPSGTNVNLPAAFTRLNCVAVNPHSAFPELWIGSNVGKIKIPLSDFMTADFKRYHYWISNGSNNITGLYANPTNFLRSDGVAHGNRLQYGDCSERPCQFLFGVDGRVYCRNDGLNNSYAASYIFWSIYSHQSDNWHCGQTDEGWDASNWGTQFTMAFLDPYGTGFAAGCMFAPRFIFGFETQYQWIGGAWVPQEVVLGSLPDSTSTPGCSAKDMHTTFQDLIMGVRVKFTAQGGGTQANNEFLGTAGIIKPDGAPSAVRNDGSVTSGLSDFNGSSFSTGDVGRYLRIESGGQQNVYRIIGFSNTTKVTLGHCDMTSDWTSSGNESDLQYSVWDTGIPASPGGTAGPEPWTVGLFDGLGKDNTQDLSYITYETFQCKTLLSEDVETVKFCVPNFIGPKGSRGMKLYWSNYLPTTNPQYNAAVGSVLGLGAGSGFPAMTAIADFLPSPLDGLVDRNFSYDTSIFGGAYADHGFNMAQANSTMGLHAVIDLGTDVDVGYVIFRGNQVNAYDDNGTLGMTFNETYGMYGLVGKLSKFNHNATPPTTDLTQIRCQGTSNLTTPGAYSTLVTCTGATGFLGTQDGMGMPTDGITTQNSNSFDSAVGRFSQSHVGQVLQIVSGAHANDIGYYRILTADGDGSTITVQNLDGTAKAWTATTSGVSFKVWDAVRPEDTIFYPDTVTPTGYLCVERLTAYNIAQVRTGPAGQLTNVSWKCVKPLWSLVKRLSTSYAATPPEVANNKTWISAYGKSSINARQYMIYMDLTDLTQAQRTGRWWKFTMQPKFNNDGNWPYSYAPATDTIEFYDTSGNRIGHCNYNRVDSVVSQPNFLMAAVSQITFLMATNSGYPATGFNGLCSLADDVVTLDGGNTFGPFVVRPGLMGSFNSGTSLFDATLGSFFVSADVGRWLHITSGSQSGLFLRITGMNSASQVTVANIDGSAFVWGSSETGLTFRIHEGINAGVSLYDTLYIDGYGEAPILSVSNDRSTITLGVRTTKAVSGKAWEVRRKALPVIATPGVDASQSARLFSYLYDGYAPIQSGDVQSDSRGYHVFWSGDCGNGMTRINGNPQAGTDHFTVTGGYSFFGDDVGRVIHIPGPTDNNVGFYLIASRVGSSEVTVTHMDGSAVSFAAGDVNINYKVWGERRFRINRYVTGLKA